MSGPAKPTDEIHPERTVRCVRCEHRNPHRHNACEKCGAHLHVLCHKCGQRNARVHSRCTECGHRLHRPFYRRILHKIFGKNKVLRTIFGKNSRLSALQVILLLIGIAIAYVTITYLADFRVHVEEKE
jgi:hypothetical protein